MAARKDKVNQFPCGKGYDLGRDGVSQSILSTFLSCRQAARYYLDLWESPSVSFALMFGTLFHSLLEHYYKALATGQGVKAFVGFDAVFSHWVAKDAGSIDAQKLEQFEAMAFALFGPYCKHWEKEDLKRQWVGVETVFDTNWEGYRLRGMRDGMFLVNKGKEHWILEHKTTTTLDSDSLSLRLNFDLQNLFYILNTEQEYGVKVAGVLYDLIRKPALRQGKKESFNEFASRMVTAVNDAPGEYFARFPLVYPETVKQRFRAELALQLADFRDWSRGLLPTYKNPSACIGRGVCEFLPVCAAGGNAVAAGCIKSRVLFRELIR